VCCLLTDTDQSEGNWFNIYLSENSRTHEAKPWFQEAANLVPLHPDIVAALTGERREHSAALKLTLPDSIESLEKLLSFKNVKATATKHAKEWKFGCAIGCYRLASFLCPPSYDRAQRLEIACEPIRHLRHHVHYGILKNTLLDIEELLCGMSSSKGETLLSLEYDLLALLDEHGLQHMGMDYAKELHHKNVIEKYGKNLTPERVGSIKRRLYSICLTDPYRTAMRKLRDQLEERAKDVVPLRASLATTQVVEALLAFMKSDQKSATKALEVAWEQVCSQCDKFQEAFDVGDKPNAGPSDVAELFYYRGVLAHLVRSQGWKHIEADSCDSAVVRFSECRALLTNPYVGFWNAVLHRAGVGLSSDAAIARLTRRLSRKELPEHIQDIVRRILGKTRRMLMG